MPRSIKPRNFSTPDEVWEQVEAEAAESGQSKSAVITAALGQYFRSKIVRSAWTVEDDDGWYDPKKFYTHTEDKNHHSAKVTMNVPKNLAGAIQSLVTSRAIPELRSPADFYRSALFHESHRIGKWIESGEITQAVSMATIQADLDHFIQQRLDMDNLVESIAKTMDAALTQTDTIPFAEAKMKELWGQVSSIPEMFKKDYVDTLERYGVKLRAVKEGMVRPIIKGRGRLGA